MDILSDTGDIAAAGLPDRPDCTFFATPADCRRNSPPLGRQLRADRSTTTARITQSAAAFERVARPGSTPMADTAP
jgi:hypothetical protein